MIDLFDKLGDTLNDMIGSHDNNNVKHVITQTFASGGFAGVSGSDPLTASTDSSLGGILREVSNAYTKTANANPGGNIFGGSGSSYYSSPVGITAHLQSAYGNFFRGVGEPGSQDKPAEKPQPTQPIKSETPNDFYAKWYNRMRQFAEAEEVANRGQVQVRGR